MRALVRNSETAETEPEALATSGMDGNKIKGTLVGRTSWSAADVLVGLLDCIANGASRTGKTKRRWVNNRRQSSHSTRRGR